MIECVEMFHLNVWMCMHMCGAGEGGRDLHRSGSCFIGCEALQSPNEERGVGPQSLLIATQETFRACISGKNSPRKNSYTQILP